MTFKHLGRRKRLPIRPCAAGLLVLASSGPLQAQDAAPAAAAPGTPSTTLPVVRVHGSAETADGPVQGYHAKRAASATKTDTPLNETPQSITVVTRDMIIDQGAANLQDALNYAAGVRSDAYGLDSRTDSVRIRGGYPDEYLDGLRKTFSYYTSNGRTEPYTLERIEVLRGPAAMLYGQGSTGGVVNMVSKRPQAEAQGEVGVQVGSWKRRQIQADLTGPLTADGQWLYRLVALARRADTQVDHVPDDRSVLAPSLTWRPSAATSLTLQGLWQRDRSGSTSQFFPWSGVITPNPNGSIPTNRFIGEPGFDRYDTDRRSFGWLFEHQFNDAWTLRQNVRRSRNEVDYRTLYGDFFSLPGGYAADPIGQRLYGRVAWINQNTTTVLAADQHLEGRFEAAGLKHHLLFGVDAIDSKQDGAIGSDDPVNSGGNVPLIDVFTPVYGGFTPPVTVAQPRATQRQFGVYLQDQLRIGSALTVVAGLRHDRARTGSAGAPTEKTQATTKRLGAMVALGGGWSPYVSYSESFTPVANIGALAFAPLRGTQWEGGVKFDAPDGGVSFNANVYDLREKNQVVETVPNVYRQLGQTRTRGAELELKAAVSRKLDLSAHYNYTDLDPLLEGGPRHTAALWGKWRFALAGVDGFSIGAGVRAMSAFHDGAGPQVPRLTLFDALLAWDAGAWRAALNVNNLTDKVYVSTCLARGDCWWGARRNAVASVTYRF